jgi:hypothetical protein
MPALTDALAGEDIARSSMHVVIVTVIVVIHEISIIIKACRRRRAGKA